ncbi:MAG TPA: sensor histidine kinase [Bryobacteraceae bacterium]|nr:sensor histidine kinase [Bryobacteraceae bacterium]
MRKLWPAHPKAPGLVLWLGFGGLLVCILGAAVGTLTALDRVSGEETRIRRAFLQRLSSLDTIRSEIYLSGTYVRDFLLSPDPSGAEAQAGRLTSLERETRAALDGYSHLIDPGDRQPFLTLQNEIDEYWHILNRTMAWTPQQRNRLRDSFFYDQLVPRRTAMLQIADRIALVNERGLARSEDRLAQSSGNLRRTLLATFAITLAGGLVLALLTIAYTLRLERELGRRFEENARARADLQELSARLLRAQENERRSLARELHDEVGQSLSAILMEAENAECADDPREIREHLASVKTLAGKTVNEVRDLALLLRPSMLDDFGLVPALNWHAREMAKRTGLNVVVAADDEADDLPDEHKTCIYRLVQEAVNNSARHANARNVEVTVRREGARVRFSVRDDGAGFDSRFVRGLGLLGMEERVRRLGGQFRLDSQLGRGTVIAAELPVAELNGTGPHPGSSPGPAATPDGRVANSGSEGGAQKAERNGAVQRG